VRDGKTGITVSRSPATAAGVALVVVAVLIVFPASSASFPGANGKIAFARDGRIYTVLPDGSGLTMLSSKGASDRAPSWSGDGMRIAYQSCCSRGNWQIWVMGETGAGKVNVSKSTFADTQPAFSPDGQRIAFVRSGQIWVMNADGTAKTRLTAPSGYTDDEPSWSPDGQKIAFQRCCYPIPGWPPEISQIFTVDAAGQNARNVSGTLGSTSDFHPDWSPDGSKIVFARYDGINLDEIYVMAANGSGQTRLSPGTNANRPRWSPDGRQVVFDLGGSWVKTMPASGGVPTTLTTGWDPAWQPRP
jgi:TolB protein